MIRARMLVRGGVPCSSSGAETVRVSGENWERTLAVGRLLAELIEDEWDGGKVVVLRNPDPSPLHPDRSTLTELPVSSLAPPGPSRLSLMSSKLPLSSNKPARCKAKNPPPEDVEGESEVEVILSAPGDLVRSRERAIFVGLLVTAPLVEEDPIERTSE